MDIKVKFNSKEYDFKDWLNEMKFVNDVNYNIVSIDKSCVCDLMKENEDDAYASLYIDGIKLDYPNEIEEVGHNKFKFVIPNDSVMRKAQNLMTALNGHRKENYFTKKSDFDINDYVDLPIEEQLMVILEYLRSRIKLNHFIHYELMVYGMTRDDANRSQRVTKDTKNILFMHSNDILLFPDRNHSIASTLPYGYINKAFQSIYKNNQPDEYDILYSNILNKKPKTDGVYREMNSTMAKAFKENDEFFGYMEKKEDK